MRIAVIGAGLAGITTAWLLARAGHEVIVLDRREAAGLETSFANGGMLTPSQAAPWNSPGIALQVLRWLGREDSPFLLKLSQLPALAGWGRSFLYHSRADRFVANLAKNVRLGRYSLQCLREMRSSFGLQYDHSTRGTMKLYRTSASLQQAANDLAIADIESIRHEVLGASAVLKLEPALQAVVGSIAGGIYFPDDESGDAHLFCREIERLAGDAGVQFRYGTEVQALLHNSQRLMAVQTRKGEIKADVYLLSAGCYSPLLARTAGIKLPIYPVKGYSLTLDLPDPAVYVPAIPVIDELKHVAVTPLGHRLRIAGKAELAGYDTRIVEGRIYQLMKFFREVYPRAAQAMDLNQARPWAGLRPYTADGVPLLGGTALKNLYLNTGHGHLGWTFAAGSARLLTDLISGQPIGLDLHPYLLSRFH